VGCFLTCFDAGKDLLGFKICWIRTTIFVYQPSFHGKYSIHNLTTSVNQGHLEKFWNLAQIFHIFLEHVSLMGY
jgi:hypothetical protein